MAVPITVWGGIHTAISVAAVAAGFVAIARSTVISTKDSFGRLYVWLTVITCLSGLTIFHHGGFGKAHALALATLAVLLLAYLAERSSLRLSWLAYVAASGYLLTLFFHAIPAATEILTRAPPSNPVATGADDGVVQTAVGICFLVFLLGATWQIVVLRRHQR